MIISSDITSRWMPLDLTDEQLTMIQAMTWCRTLPEPMFIKLYAVPNSKVHGGNVGPTCGRQDPRGPHVGHMKFAIWDI